MTLDVSPVDSTKAAHRRKAPRVRRIPWPFAGPRVKRPSTPGGRLREQPVSPTVPDELALRVQTRREGSTGPVGPPASAGRRQQAAHESGSIGGIAGPSSLRKALSRRTLVWEVSQEASRTREWLVRRNRYTGDMASAWLLGKRCRFPAGIAAIARQEVLERIESGQSSIGGRRPARRPWTGARGPYGLRVTPMEGDGGRKPLLPWLESTRLTTSGSAS
jgi:hypothetical protein